MQAIEPSRSGLQIFAASSIALEPSESPRGRVHRAGTTVRFEKYASVVTCDQSAIPPPAPPCLRSFTIRHGCAAPFPYSFAVVPLTTILILVHAPASTSTYDS